MTEGGDRRGINDSSKHGAVSREIPDNRIEKYIAITESSLSNLIILPLPEVDGKLRAKAEEFLEMAEAYYKDALHFRDKGDIVNAYGCINYSQGWLDAGVRMGLFKMKKR